MKRFVGMVLIAAILAAITGVLFLRNGISLESFSAGPATLTNISLKWQRKLELQVDILDIVSAPGQSEQDVPDLSFIGKIPSAVHWLDRLFTRISIGKVVFGQVSGRLLYEASELTLSMGSEIADLTLKASLDGEKIHLVLEDLQSSKFSSRAEGNFQFDTKSRKGKGVLSMNLAHSLPVKLDIQFDEKQFSFQGREAGEITTITPVVDLFGLDHSIQKWITDYLVGSRYRLQSLAGNFPWNDPLQLTKTFTAEIQIDDCQYTFGVGLEAVKSDYTNLSFAEGVLVIKPHIASFYGQDGGDSWLDINFNDPDNILLSAHVLVRAQANQDIVNLLQFYDIPLPFRQTEGMTDADLLIAINLNSEDVSATGSFTIEEGYVDCWEENFKVRNAQIILDSSQVRIEQLEVSFGEFFTADIVGDFNGISGKGAIDIDLRNFSLDVEHGAVRLDTSTSRPTLHFTIDPDGDTLSASASEWDVIGIPMKLGPFTTPFDQETLSGNLSLTTLVAEPKVAAEFSGAFSIKKKELDLQVNVLHLDVPGMRLQNDSQPFHVQFDGGLTVTSSEESLWMASGIPVTLSPNEFTVFGTTYAVKGGAIRFGDYFDAIVSGSYDLSTLKGRFLLEDLDVQVKSIGHFFDVGDTLVVDVEDSADELTLKVADLDMEVVFDSNNSWAFFAHDLGALYDYSPFLQKYLLKNGSVSVVSREGGGYRFSADIPFDYALSVKNGVPVTRYQVKGAITKEGVLRAMINSNMEVLYDTTLRLSTRDGSFNIPEIRRFIADLPPSDEEEFSEDESLQVNLQASNIRFILSPTRAILSDTVALSYDSGKLKMLLTHGPGKIRMDIKGNDFALSGEGLDDVFMDGLFPGADFDKGRMSIAAKGNFDEFNAIIKMEDTILLNFKALNNVLALVNTIPALVTFSLPSYSSQGLHVNSITSGLAVKDGVVTFRSMDLDSPEITMTGTGWIDTNKETIDMDLNLITQAKKNVNKIPLVGYVLVGNEKRSSITVKISGSLFDPTVEHSTYKAVAATPFFMLYRTLALPLHLVAPVFGIGEEGQDKKGGKQDGAVEGGQDWDL
jgi:hypothetical protein